MNGPVTVNINVVQASGTHKDSRLDGDMNLNWERSPGSMSLTLVPPLFFRLMDPRVDKLRLRDARRHNTRRWWAV